MCVTERGVRAASANASAGSRTKAVGFSRPEPTNYTARHLGGNRGRFRVGVYPVSRPRGSRHNSRASRLAALLLVQILPVFSLVAPCHPGAALRDLCHDPRGRDTSRPMKK